MPMETSVERGILQFEILGGGQMDQSAVRQLVARISQLLGDKFGARGADLETRVSRVGRKLPRRIRAAAHDLITADKLSKDPRLSLQLDPQHTSSAYAQCLDYLIKIDNSASRSRARYGLAATVAGQLLLVAVATVYLLRSRGYL